jgi:pimeloyl-ACP methyl ester carboxylesterase
VLDSARAAQRFGGGSDELILFGHSQGGHAVILANEMASSYAPELKVLGTIGSGSGVFSTSGTLLDYVKNSDYKGYVVMVALGQEAAYGPLESPLSRWLTVDGIEASRFLKDEEAGNCVTEVTSTFAPLTSDYLFVPNAPQPLLATDADSFPGLKSGASPLLMIHGRDDDQLPPQVIIPWVEGTCDIGQEILLEWFDTGHRVPYVDPDGSAAVIFPWIDNRLAGRPVPSSCSAVPQP